MAATRSASRCRCSTPWAGCPIRPAAVRDPVRGRAVLVLERGSDAHGRAEAGDHGARSRHHRRALAAGGAAGAEQHLHEPVVSGQDRDGHQSRLPAGGRVPRRVLRHVVLVAARRGHRLRSSFSTIPPSRRTRSSRRCREGAHPLRGPAQFEDQSSVGEVDVLGAVTAADRLANPELALPAADRSWLDPRGRRLPRRRLDAARGDPRASRGRRPRAAQRRPPTDSRTDVSRRTCWSTACRTPAAVDVARASRAGGVGGRDRAARRASAEAASRSGRRSTGRRSSRRRRCPSRRTRGTRTIRRASRADASWPRGQEPAGVGRSSWRSG